MSDSERGVELVGLVLAIIPLVLSGIEKTSDFRFQALKYIEIYGPLGALLPLLCSSDAWQLAEKILKTTDDKMVLSFVSAQIAQANMVAVTGAIMAQIAITALALEYLSAAHWVARAVFLASLLAGCASVYYAMYQLRTFGRLITLRDVKKWLRGLPREIKDTNKNIPSAAAVLVLDTPRGLVDMAAASFVCGLSIYVVFVFINDLDGNAGKDSRNITIAYFVSMWLCATLYSRSFVFDIYVGSTPTWRELARYLGFVYDLSQRPSNADVDTENVQEDRQSRTPSRKRIDSYFVMDSLAPMAAQSASRQSTSHTRVATDNSPDNGESTESQSANEDLTAVSTALQETIIARSKCLKADQRLLDLLQKLQATFGGRF